MRKINKLTPLPNFNGNNYNIDCKIWSCKKCTDITFHNKYKSIYEDTRWQILIDEQNQLCGYTELYIGNLEDSHIDHYRKREDFSTLTFEWNNLVVSIGGKNLENLPYGAHYKDNTYKIKKTEYSSIFNPVIDNVENYFHYDEFGMIRADEGKVKKTVKVFNLNHPYLKERRANIIKLIDMYKKGGLSKNDIESSLTNSGFKSVLNQYL